jgi:hypothetical protein
VLVILKKLLIESSFFSLLERSYSDLNLTSTLHLLNLFVAQAL